MILHEIFFNELYASFKKKGGKSMWDKKNKGEYIYLIAKLFNFIHALLYTIFKPSVQADDVSVIG